MSGESEGPIALGAYELLADRFAALVETKPYNAWYERPATLSLLPPVKGRRVLDAGCGPGVYAAWLLDQGAEVLALDASPRMVRLAQDRLGGRAQVVQADLGKPLGFLENTSFDLVLSALALDHVKDWGALFAEFHRVLKRPGHLVFSVSHPFDEYYDHHPGGCYFDLERVEMEWRSFGPPAVVMPSYRRPLQAMLDPLLEVGFRLEKLLEPVPQERFRNEDPRDYKKLTLQPGFLCIRAAKAEP